MSESDPPSSNPGGVSQEWHAQAPRVSDALRKGMPVSVTTWGGREVTGLVCDREQSGLLLEVRGSGDGPSSHIFLPWTSVEQVEIQEITPRRVKFLPG